MLCYTLFLLTHLSLCFLLNQVFAITSTFGIFAYLWLFLILVIFSPNEVELWEGALTFIFFPILVTLAWMGDRNFFQPESVPSNIELGKIAGEYSTCCLNPSIVVSFFSLLIFSSVYSSLFFFYHVITYFGMFCLFFSTSFSSLFSTA